MTEMTCETCTAFRICPHEPKREDYTDENKYLIDLESGVWSCKRTIQELCKENEALKEQVPIWHDLRKDPNDLPKRIGLCTEEVLISYKAPKPCSDFGYFRFDTKKWYSYETAERCKDEVIAWCEIPTFKE